MKRIVYCILTLSLATLTTLSASAQAKKPVAKKPAANKTAGANGLQKLKSGLEYKIIRRSAETAPSPKISDVVEMNILVHIKDSILFDSRKVMNDKPVTFPVQKPSFNGDPVEGFMLMRAGDSAVFFVLVDSLKKGAQLPPWMKPGMKLEYNVNLISVKDAAKVKAEAEELAAARKGVDDKLLNDYFEKNQIKPSKTASGVYYTIKEQGTGEAPQAGQSVTVNYTGKTLDGKTFDSNVDSNFHHVSPFTFSLGKHQVITGWDDGIPMIKKGGKGTLYIPSGLAYGAQSPSPAIPAYSVLIFDVEVTDVKADVKQ